MLALLWIVPALPLLGSLMLMVSAGRLPRRVIATVGVGSVGLSALLAAATAAAFVGSSLAGDGFRQELWHWIPVDDFDPQIAFRLDPLSMVMMLVVTWIGFFIHLYSSEFMQTDEGYSGFFAYMNLFVGAMLVLVLADDLLLLYAGWEGVGLCSYLLIGFWYQDPANGYAARKAFVITRIGDVAMLIGIILIFTQLGTFEIAQATQLAAQNWPAGSSVATATAALLLGGAVGKSAQLPLQTWLPDAMAGPTPVSALIHAATMVTAGVYLIARTHGLFELAPVVEMTVGAIGAATLLIAAFAALAQNDIKRILAYSTMSQIGYMFVALGVGAWTAAIFHLITHACFKALLFLAAGAVMMRVNDEHDIFRMGGLRRELPEAFASFLIGAASLAAVPLITAGFYSKDMILSAAWNTGDARGRVLWGAALIGAFLTAVYIFRAVFVVFFGERRIAPSGDYGWRIVAPLAILSVFSVTAGFIDAPPWLGGFDTLSRLLEPVLPIGPQGGTGGITTVVLASVASLGGVFVAYLIYYRFARALESRLSLLRRGALGGFFGAGWGFDWLYDRLIVRPFVAIAHLNRNDVADLPYADLAFASWLAHVALSRSETGRVRWYVGWAAAGSLAVIAIAALT
jgi:NADH-quinone oxidoreductase subunit L